MFGIIENWLLYERVIFELSENLKSKHEVSKIDILFLDHDKTDYLPTLRNLEKQGLIGKNSVIIADNAIHPGSGFKSILGILFFESRLSTLSY